MNDREHKAYRELRDTFIGKLLQLGYGFGEWDVVVKPGKNPGCITVECRAELAAAVRQAGMQCLPVGVEIEFEFR